MDPHVLLFDLDSRGHHAGYLMHLLEYWDTKNLPGQLSIIISPGFIQKHTELIRLPTPHRSHIQIVPIQHEEYYSINRSGSMLTKSVREWRLLQKYAKELNVDHCVVMLFDKLQPGMVLQPSMAKNKKYKLSGIYFRPMFHYDSFGRVNFSFKQRGRKLLKWLVLRRALRNQQLNNLFCLDPFAVDYLKSHIKETKFVYLPDPVKIHRQSTNSATVLRQRFDINNKKKIFLSFGIQNKRKGIDKLLLALSELPENTLERMILLLVGPFDHWSRDILDKKLKQNSKLSRLQIIVDDQFISDREIQPYFQVADVVLALYQRHIGMSAVLVRSAAAGKPTLSSDFGLMGQIVRQKKLGIVVDSSQPKDIARGLLYCLEVDPQNLANAESMKAFAEQNTPTQFAETIYETIL